MTGLDLKLQIFCLKQEPKKKYIFNDTTGLPDGYDEKILEYSAK